MELIPGNGKIANVRERSRTAPGTRTLLEPYSEMATPTTEQLIVSRQQMATILGISYQAFGTSDCPRTADGFDVRESVRWLLDKRAAEYEAKLATLQAALDDSKRDDNLDRKRAAEAENAELIRDLNRVKRDKELSRLVPMEDIETAFEQVGRFIRMGIASLSKEGQRIMQTALEQADEEFEKRMR